MVIDMGSKCFWGMIPTGQSNRLGSRRHGGAAKLARWASADTVSAFDKICFGLDIDTADGTDRTEGGLPRVFGSTGESEEL